MTRLSKSHFDTIVKLLAPHLKTRSERESFLLQAFYEAPELRNNIDLSGNPQTFAVHLVSKADQFGKIDGGQWAEVALLQQLRERVGFEQKQHIDRLLAAIEIQSAPPQPEATQNLNADGMGNQAENSTGGCLNLLRGNLFQFVVGTTIALFSLMVAIIALPQVSQPTTATIDIPTAAPTATFAENSTPTTLTNNGFPCEGEIVFTTGALLNVVRAIPSNTAPSRPPVQQGTIINIVNSQNVRGSLWYEIEYEGNSGWLTEDFITDTTC